MEGDLSGRRWPAVAKINLFLHITGRRQDGYHELQTLFQLLDYGDDLGFELRDDGNIRRKGDLGGVPEDQDLCLRAARLLRDSAGGANGVTISVSKRVPLGGGLGGGSSDAATTLLALNRLWETGLSRPELAELGLQLGADVPVFIAGRSAWAEGVGEILEPVSLDPQWYVVITPPVSVSTANVFANKHLTRDTDPITIRDFHAGRCENQLESVVRAEFREVDNLLNWLSNFGQPRMTGSGSSVFLPVPDEETGRSVLAESPAESTGFVARGLNEHPLLNL